MAVLQFHSSIQPSIWILNHRVSPNFAGVRRELMVSHALLKWNRLKPNPIFQLRAVGSSEDGSSPQDEVVKGCRDAMVEFKHSIEKLQGMVSTLPPVVFVMRRQGGNGVVIWLCFATAFLVIAVRMFMARKTRQSRPGTVADLVRRGQLRSDRRGISTPLKYEDPFNNPMVKLGKSNSTVEMCGKVYKLAPVTLTKEEQAIHKKRRSRAYQWKRPTIFLKEGDSIPADVDPDTVRWIPANHPFATTSSDIDEDLAQTNVYQKHGVPFRIRAEHEALQRKLEALQNEEKLNKLTIDSSSAKDFERSFKLNQKSSDQTGDTKSSRSDSSPNSINSSNSSSEETQKP
ncbi:protein MULTIPLE CHLOROPLAST DIVISION SITE 1 [Euphorbia lathyris]|uniref:protein MULTIPLE CHLOROPLAST DIVISION SITE 1 n=1 Tax=Euphorbia lathyris TaxID=212925 RepID=UPI0033139197